MRLWNLNPKKTEYRWVFVGFPCWQPLRVALRFGALLGWLFGSLALLQVGSLVLASFPNARQTFRRTVWHIFVSGFCTLLGTRMRVEGHRPERPYLIVTNHISWIDYFVLVRVLGDCCICAQDDITTFPLLGPLIRAGDPVPVRRVREAVPETLALMERELRAGRSMLMAPESMVGPGKRVRRFRASLLEAAIRLQMPVHYMSLTCRTPEGYPPASRMTFKGPDRYYFGDKIPPEELTESGPPQRFLPHLLRLLGLPWHEYTVRFGDKPIAGTERIPLAQQLQAAVEAIFTPVE